MTKITYEIVEHDEGWAYKLDDVFSDTYETREQAEAAAEDAAERQQRAGADETIQYQDADGTWQVENASGSDRPDVDVDHDAKD